MGGRFVVTALIAMTLLSLVLTSVPDRRIFWVDESNRPNLQRIGQRSYTFGDWNIRRAVSTGHKRTDGNGRQ
uniref:Conotoxin n=1 Tax=Conus andremenezi TaxID=1077466 RepID=A0A291C277_9COND|nr:conotoxin [Conus andremenezi]